MFEESDPPIDEYWYLHPYVNNSRSDSVVSKVSTVECCNASGSFSTCNEKIADFSDLMLMLAA